MIDARTAATTGAGDDLAQRALLAHRAGRLTEAEACYRTLLDAHPKHPALLNNLALVLVAQRRYAEAVPVFESSLAARPGQAHVLVGLSNALNFCNRPRDALHACDALLAREPALRDARHNKAVALRALNRHDEAMVELRALLAEDPHDGDAEYNLALSELVTGDFASGWRHYEARWRGRNPHRAPPDRGIPRWHPGVALHGRRVLVQAEQGLGDTLHFVRFVAHLSPTCASVAVEVQDALAPLLQRNMPALRIQGTSAMGRPDADVAIPLLSLPLALGLNDACGWPATGAYLTADPDVVSAWRARLPTAPKRVGLAWRGNPDHRNDHNRSIPVVAFEPWLAAMQEAQVEVFALHRDVNADEREWLARFPHVRVPNDAIGDIESTAALLAVLDRVISVDTAIAHLAGAMARPCTVLLPFAPDWRWGASTQTTSYYRTLRLLRQREIGDWQEPIAQLAASTAGDLRERA